MYTKFHISGIIGRASLSTSSCDIQNQHCRQKRQNTLSSESGQHDRIVLETAPVALFPHQHATGMYMWIYPKLSIDLSKNFLRCCSDVRSGSNVKKDKILCHWNWVWLCCCNTIGSFWKRHPSLYFHINMQQVCPCDFIQNQ